MEGVILALSHFGMMGRPTLPAHGPGHSPKETGGPGAEQPMIHPNGVTAGKDAPQKVRQSKTSLTVNEILRSPGNSSVLTLSRRFYKI